MLFYIAVAQPSTTIIDPVMKEDAVDAKKDITFEISSGVPTRFNNVVLPCWCNAALGDSWELMYCSSIGVITGPGQTQFTRIPSSAWSTARARVN